MRRRETERTGPTPANERWLKAKVERVITLLETAMGQPEMRPQLMGQMLFTGGLMEAFPMIVLGIAMWFIFANPFVGAAQTAIGG